MTPEDQERAYRRGRWMLLILAAVTLGIYAFNSLLDVLSRGWRDEQSEAISGFLLVGFFCWSLLRGGVTGRAVFILVHSVFLALYWLAVVCTLSAIIFHWRGEVGGEEIYLYAFHGREQLCVATLLGLWSAWTLWALIFSHDVRTYVQARRRGERVADAAASAWPPAHRRPQ